MKTVKETQNLVDFGLFYTAKENYDAAKLLKENNFTKTPYYILLSFSIECFLKSIRTTTKWIGSKGVSVDHKDKHPLSNIFNSIEKEHPDDANYLKDRYESKYGRLLKYDIDLNSEVFTKKRYPYLKDGKIPYPELRGINSLSLKHDNSIMVYVTQLEDVADFLHDELKIHFNGCF